MFRTAHAQDWLPVVGSELAELSTRDDLGEHQAEQEVGELWQEAKIQSLIPLLRESIATRALGFGEAEGWWQSALADEPNALVLALGKLDTRYVVWGVARWPEDRQRFVKQYRVSLMRHIFEALHAHSEVVAARQGAFQAMRRPDVYLPDGYPFGTAPSAIENEQQRELYVASLNAQRSYDERARDLRKLQAAEGELVYAAKSKLFGLYDSAGSSEIENLAAIIVNNKYLDLRFVTELRASWAELDQAVLKLAAAND